MTIATGAASARRPALRGTTAGDYIQSAFVELAKLVDMDVGSGVMEHLEMLMEMDAELRMERRKLLEMDAGLLVEHMKLLEAIETFRPTFRFCVFSLAPQIHSVRNKPKPLLFLDAFLGLRHGYFS